MAKKSSVKQNNILEEYQHYVIPSVIGGVIVWFFSGSLGLAIAVFLGVWAGNWIGNTLRHKK